MNKEDIEGLKGKKIKVDILRTGRDGNTLCFEVWNEKLGKFIISNCHYNINHLECPDPENHLNGSVSMWSSDGIIHYPTAFLNIDKDDSSKGVVEFK